MMTEKDNPNLLTVNVIIVRAVNNYKWFNFRHQDESPFIMVRFHELWGWPQGAGPLCLA